MQFPKMSLTLYCTFASSAAFAVSPDNEELEKVVVTASGSTLMLKDAPPPSISVLDKEDLSERYYQNLTDAMTDIPGVIVTGGDGDREDISLRGMGSQYTLMLVDGQRQTSAKPAPTAPGSRRYRQLNASKSSAAPCLHSTAQMPLVV